MTRNAITASGAAAVGPYSHAVDSDGLVYLSGQTPLDPATGRLVDGPIEAQARQCFANLFNVLAAADLDHRDVVAARGPDRDRDDRSTHRCAEDVQRRGQRVGESDR